MVGTFKTIHLTPKYQVSTVVLPYSPQFSIWMLVGSQGNFWYTPRVVITFKSLPWVKSASLLDQNPIQLGPNLVHLTHFVTGVGSGNLKYALTVVITFINVLWPTVSGLYFQNWLFWPNLAQIWPKFDPTLVHLTHFVTGVGSSNLIYSLTVVITFRNILRPKVSGLYFQNWLFGSDLAQIWPNLVLLKACKGWHYVSSALEVLMTLKNMLRLKI
jgi:hypothetical protein